MRSQNNLRQDWTHGNDDDDDFDGAADIFAYIHNL